MRGERERRGSERERGGREKWMKRKERQVGERGREER